MQKLCLLHGLNSAFILLKRAHQQDLVFRERKVLYLSFLNWNASINLNYRKSLLSLAIVCIIIVIIIPGSWKRTESASFNANCDLHVHRRFEVSEIKCRGVKFSWRKKVWLHRTFKVQSKSKGNIIIIVGLSLQTCCCKCHYIRWVW